jgi:PAS domain S-box-containing protein
MAPLPVVPPRQVLGVALEVTGVREVDPALRPVEAASPWARHLAWLPIPMVVTIAAVVYGRHSTVVYESALLQTTLSTLFRASVSLLIAYLAARTYLVSGSRAVLALGCGALAFCTASLLAGLLMADPNASVTAHNGGFCLAGACFLLSAGWAVRPRQAAAAAAPLAFSYLAVPVAVGLLAGGALAGVMPGFLIGAHGYTPLRQATLGLTVLEFALASLCFIVLYARSRTPFLRWYGIGLALVGMGVLLNIVEGSPGTALSWVARSGQYLGGLYMLVGIMTVAEGRWGWRIPLERALHESEGRYQVLVEASPDAIIVHRDGQFLYVNPAALKLYGAADLRQLSAHGVLDLVSPEERAEASAGIEQAYAEGGVPMRERRLLRLDGSEVPIEVVAAPIMYQGVPAMQAVLRDITTRKQAEAERERLLRAERKARAQAGAALQLRDEFLSVAVHEFRTPITSVRGYAPHSR